jgi:hypothetical protein
VEKIIYHHRPTTSHCIAEGFCALCIDCIAYISSTETETETETERLDAEDMSYVRFVTCVVQRTQLVPEICQASPVVQMSRIGKLALHSHGT